MQLTNRFREKSLKSQILWVYIPLLVASVILVLLFISNASHENRRREAYYQLENSTDVMTLLLEDRLESILGTFVAMEESDAFSRMLLQYRYGSAVGGGYETVLNMGNMLEGAYGQYYNIIDSVYINLNGSEFTLMKRYFPRYRAPDVTVLYEAYGESGHYYWQPLHTDPIFTASSREVFSLLKFFGSPGQKSNVFGMMLLNIRKEYILDLMHNMPISENGYWTLVTDDGLYTADPIDDYSLRSGAVSFLQENRGRKGHFETRSTAGEPMYVYFDGFGNAGWGIAAVMPTAELNFLVSPLNYNSLLLVLAVVVVMLFFAVFFADHISRSLRELSRRVERFDGDMLPEGDNAERAIFHLEGSKEVEVLSDALDSMTGTIHHLVENIFEKQKHLRQVELAALQEQIKPHFIYNSLSTVLYEIDGGQNEQAGEMLRSLITFFRLSVNRGNEVFTLSDEIAHASSYLRIQQLRNSYRFTYEIQADEDLYRNEILKFTLQPLVENCLSHGFIDRAASAENHIVVTITEQRGCVCIEVLDNGTGISAEKLQQLRGEIGEAFSDTSSVTYGLKNVDLRIRLKYGNAYGVSIESEPGLFTAVKVLLPVRRFAETE